MLGLSARCGHFAATLASIPAAAAELATMGIVDAIGVMLAARDESVVAAACAMALDGSPQGASSVLLSARSTRAADAAFINATAAHAFAMDDVAVGCHPSAILMPALLAEAQAVGASGADLLRAYVVGFELLSELASREPDTLHATGWHPTGLLGPVAVAGAVGNLLQLSAEQCTHAIGIAASMGGGLQANFGTPTKALHAGNVASAGVRAARLAQRGVTASVVALEHPRGLLRTISPAGRVDTEREPSFDADRPRILTAGPSIKKYPFCYSTHRVIDAAIDLAATPGFDAESISRIEVAIGRRQAAMAPHHLPRTALEARYSVEFAVVAGLVAGAAGFAQLDESFIRSPLVCRLLENTSIGLREDVSVDDPVFGVADQVRVGLAGGATLSSAQVRHARGHALLPLAPDDLRGKFIDCVLRGGRRDAAALYEALSRMADQRDLRHIDGLIEAD